MPARSRPASPTTGFSALACPPATGAGCNACSTMRARSAPRAVRRSKAMSCSLPAGKGRTGTSKRSEASAALGSGVAHVRPGEGGALLAEHDADFPLFAVAILVDETEDARRGAKPLGALFERPNCVRLRQPIDQALNEEIRPGAIGLLGRDDLRPEQLQRRRALACFHRWQFNARRLERNASAIHIGTEHIHLCRNASLLIARVRFRLAGSSARLLPHASDVGSCSSASATAGLPGSRTKLLTALSISWNCVTNSFVSLR